MCSATSPPEKEFVLPKCWNSDTKMEYLFDDFEQRSVNPTKYNDKMRFWKDLIMQYCTHHNNPIFSRRQVQLFFERDQDLPTCLDTVVGEMVALGLVRRRDEYEYDPLNSWTGWAMNSFLKRPMTWGLVKLQTTAGLADEYTIRGQVKYVHLAVIKQLCKQLFNVVLLPHKGELLHYDRFDELCKEAELRWSEDVVRLCLNTLRSQQKIGLELRNDDDDDEERTPRIHLIKIPGQANSSVIITEADHAVHNLQMTQSKILEQLEILEDDIKENEDKARDFVKANKRQMAKTYLRKKQLLERSRDKRSTALHNIQTLLNSVEEARSTGQIVDAYKIGSRALQAMLAGSGLSYDNVDEVLADVRESVDENRDIQQALSNTNILEDEVTEDNEELERELQDILNESGIEATETASTTPATPKDNDNKNNKNNTPLKTFENPTSTNTSTPILEKPIRTVPLLAAVSMRDTKSYTPAPLVPTSLVKPRSPIHEIPDNNNTIRPFVHSTVYQPKENIGASKNSQSNRINDYNNSNLSDISDDEEDLMRMLDSLEVEDSSLPSKGSSNNSATQARW